MKSERHEIPKTAPVITRRLDVVAVPLGSAAALGSAVLAVYWSIQIARGVPDAYSGQHSGGLLLSLSIFAGAAGGLVKRSGGIALTVVSMVCLAAAVYFFAR